MSNWSIEQELLKLSQTDSLVDAISVLGLIPAGETFKSIEGGKEWVRGGAETFHTIFQIETENSKRFKYVLKACVVFRTNEGILSVVADWTRKRDLLNSYGIVTPRLFSSSNGELLEEYIPYSLAEIDINQNLLIQLADLAGTLTRLGFLPIDGFWGDLRSHSDDVVVIDFGDDLGREGNFHGQGHLLLNQLLNQLKKWRQVSSSEVRLMRTCFQKLID